MRDEILFIFIFCFLSFSGCMVGFKKQNVFISLMFVDILFSFLDVDKL